MRLFHRVWWTVKQDIIVIAQFEPRTDRKNTDAMNGRDWVEKTVCELWREKPGAGVRELQEAVERLCMEERASTGTTAIPLGESDDTREALAQSVAAPPDPSMITKARIKHAKAWITYQEIPNPNIPLNPEQRNLVETQLHKRVAMRADRQHKVADTIKGALETMGVELDDHNKTWTVIKAPPSGDQLKVQQNDSQPEAPNEEPGSQPSQLISCLFCQKVFPSRNHVFKHLRDPTSGCGSAIFSTGQSIDDAPSTQRAKQRRDEQARRKGARGKTACHATAERTLWVGDLPLSWTSPKKQFSYLRAMLFHVLPGEVPTPWIKRVVRKAYRKGDKAKYHGYAIVVFRDAAEAALVLKAIHGMEVDPVEVFQRHTEDEAHGHLTTFSLKVCPAENSDSATANWNDIGEPQKNVPSGQDPPLADQLRPLDREELQRRLEILEQRFGTSTTDTVNSGIEETKLDEGASDHLIERLVAFYNKNPDARPVVKRTGKAVPTRLCDKLKGILETLRWPARNERDGLAAERYLVLQTNVATDRFYGELREACRELMDWADPEYHYSGIAVTKNFVASPHIDHRDQSFQYAISLGTFETGGELCVEGIDADGNVFVNVVDTHNCIGRVDGRHVHYVRTWDNGDRYSLIFYDTSERKPTPLLDLGVDLSYL
eukprot:Nitzschia sp. Nitz4//scaffold142_size57810//32794//34809//NITZ4_006497-RA/size57810-processed-gene-0.20-mRNA-1//-1//CDS//3329536394//8275//frame0